MDQYIGEIRMFGGNFAPVGFRFCDGSLMPISEYDALFSLIGTTYGGDGQETFALPDLRGRVPLHQGQLAGGSSFLMGLKGGAETVTLTSANLPVHTHGLMVLTSPATSNTPGANMMPATTAGNLLYSTDVPSTVPMSSGAVGQTGDGQPISLMMPYLAINFIIATDGVYPTPN